MQGGNHMQGYLLKRNKEHRKANLLGVKYKRRWVEVTTDTLVYASSQQEMLTGKIQVYAMQDMLWARAEAEAKFLVKFKERVLTFKVESGGAAERNKWVSALQLCKQQQAEGAGEAETAVDKIDHMRKVAEQQLLDGSSPGNSTSGSIQAYRSSQQGGSVVSSGYGGSSTAGTLPPAPVVGSYRTTETGARPLSPRSLLASAKAGSAFVSNSAELGGSVGSQYGNGGTVASSMQQQYDDSDGSEQNGVTSSDSDDDSSDSALKHSPSLQRTRNSVELAKENSVGTPRSGRQQLADNDRPSPRPAAPAAAAPPASPGEGGERASSAQIRDKRAMMARRVTPGVMLINTSEATTPTNSTTLPSVNAVGPRPLTDLLPAGSDEVLTLGPVQPAASPRVAERPGSHLQKGVKEGGPSGAASPRPSQGQSHQQQQQQQQASRAKDFDSKEEDLADEVLKLDPDEILSSNTSRHSSGNALKHSSEQQYTNRALNLSSSGSRRPESAPYTARPSSPLKSCLRSGGSSSSPSSNEALAAAAAAAVAARPGNHGSSSALSKLGESGRQGSSGQQPGHDGKDWVQDDWDDSADFDDAAASLHSGAAHASRSPERHQQKMGAGPGSSSPRVVGGAVGIRGADAGVKADKAWLDDDFDD